MQQGIRLILAVGVLLLPCCGCIQGASYPLPTAPSIPARCTVTPCPPEAPAPGPIVLLSVNLTHTTAPWAVPFVGERIRFRVELMSEPESVTIARVRWDFGDGHVEIEDWPSMKQSARAEHRWTAAGWTTIAARVEANDGRVREPQIELHIKPAPCECPIP